MNSIEHVVGGKALPVEETERGDLIIRGYAAVWDGEDRVGDSFDAKAFSDGITDFLGSQATLLYHHRKDLPIGKVLELVPDSYGLRFKARVDGAIATSPQLGTVYQQIRRGTINGVSVGGRFTRSRAGGKSVIQAVDLTEVSLTSQPMDRRPRVLEIEQKAMATGEAADWAALRRKVAILGECIRLLDAITAPR